MTAIAIVEALRGLAVYARHVETCAAKRTNDDAACTCGFTKAFDTLALAAVEGLEDRINSMPDDPASIQ